MLYNSYNIVTCALYSNYNIILYCTRILYGMYSFAVLVQYYTVAVVPVVLLTCMCIIIYIYYYAVRAVYLQYRSYW
jgi:hypothetical protein